MAIRRIDIIGTSLPILADVGEGGVQEPK